MPLPHEKHHQDLSPYWLFFLLIRPPPRSTLFPYTTLFLSSLHSFGHIFNWIYLVLLPRGCFQRMGGAHGSSPDHGYVLIPHPIGTFLNGRCVIASQDDRKQQPFRFKIIFLP